MPRLSSFLRLKSDEKRKEGAEAYGQRSSAFT